MPSIAYDATRKSLLAPAQALTTVFAAGATYTDEQLAVEAARLAYLKAEVSTIDREVLSGALSRLSFGPPASFNDAGTGAQAFGAFRQDDRLALLSFRGTQPEEITDIEADLAATLTPWKPSGGLVHAGFASRWQALRAPIEAWLKEQCAQRAKLLVCGHSLGAALATLSATVWGPAALITIGSPRVGDATFAASLGHVPTVRFVNCCDIVTQVPPDVISPYVHVGVKTYIDRTGHVRGGAAADFVLQDRIEARARYLVEEAWKAGAVMVRDLADHSPINYVRALFP